MRGKASETLDKTSVTPPEQMRHLSHWRMLFRDWNVGARVLKLDHQFFEIRTVNSVETTVRRLTAFQTKPGRVPNSKMRKGKPSENVQNVEYIWLTGTF